MTDQFKISVEAPTDFTNPLVRFTGVLKEWKQDVREYEGGKSNLGIKFDFTDVTVIESTEPYNFPIASFRVTYSDRSGTAWAEFTKTLRDIVPMDVLQGSPEPLDVLVGKSQEWYYAPVQLRRPGADGSGEEKVWKLRDGRAWTLCNLEGFGSSGGAGNILDALAEYIGDGKKDAEIYQWLYTDQSLKSMQGFSSAIEGASERTLLSSMVSAGKLKEDKGVYVAV